MIFPDDFGHEAPRHGPVRRGLGLGARILLALVGLASLALAIGSLLLTQTVVGRQVVADFVERELDGIVRGDVELGPILGGNLVSRALLDRFVIRDEAGQAFVELDSVRLEYNPISFLAGDYRFGAVTVQRARLRLLQDSTGTWNYDRIFEGDSTGEPGTTTVLLTDLAVRHGTFEMRTPWDGAPSPDEMWRVESTGPDRWERVISIDSITGRFPMIRIVDPQRPMRFEIDQLSGLAEAVRQTHRIERFDGAATFRDSVRVDIDRLVSPWTEMDGAGFVWGSDPIMFDFELRAEPLGFEDLAFLTVPTPDRGGGPAAIRLSTRPDGVLVTAVDDADIQVDESRLTGGFEIHLEDPPRFTRMNVAIPTLRLALVDEVLEREPLIDGVVSGTLTGRGPIALLDVEADLELRDPPGAAAPPAPSGLGVDGGIAIVEPRIMRDLRLDMRDFEPRWIRAVGIEPRFTGRATGTALLDGVAGGAFAFELDTEHVLETGERSQVAGSGAVDVSAGEGSQVDVELTFDPLAVRAVTPWVPEADFRDELRGEVRGPMSARGPLDDLRIIADFATPRGQVDFDGRFDVVSEDKRYDARLLARDLQLDQWFEDGPETQLVVEGRVAGTGTDPATLQASFDLAILPSRFEGARVDSSIVRFTLSEGLAVADTFAVRTEAGTIDGRGSFGLIPERSGSLILNVSAPDLSTWNAWIVPNRNPAREPGDVSDLFARFDVQSPAAEGAPADPVPATDAPTPPDSLSGSGSALGVLYGNLDRYSFGGRAILSDVAYADHRADSVSMTLDIPNPRALDTLTLRASATGAEVFGRRLDELGFRWERRDSASSNVMLTARRDTSVFVDLASEVDWTERLKRIRLDRLDVQFGERFLTLRDTATIAQGPEGFSADEVSLRSDDGAVLQFSGVVPDSGPARMDVAVRGILLENLLQFSENPNDIRGGITFGATLRGTADTPLWEAHLDVAEPSVAGVGYDALTADLTYAGRRLAIGAAVSSGGLELGRADGFLRADLSLRQVEQRLLDEPVNLDVVVDSMPLAALELGVNSVRDVDGYLRGRVLVTGEPSALRFDGDTQVHRAAMFVPALGVRLERIEGRVVFAGATARIDTLSIRSELGGSADVRGTLQLADLDDIGFDLEMRADRFYGIDRRLASLLIDGGGELNGSFQRPELTGTYRLSEGDVRVDRFLRQQQAVDLTDPAIYSLIDTTVVMEQQLFRTVRNPFTENLRLDAEIQVGPDLWLRSDAIEVELAGSLDLNMDQRTREIVAFGTLRLPRGTFVYSVGRSTDITSFLSRRLQVARGEITFVGTPGMDPNLDLDAVFRTRSGIGPVEITVHVTGTALNPSMTTSSAPPLPDSERICYLVFGSPCLGAGAQGSDFAASVLREGLIGQVGNQFSQVLVDGVGLIDYLDFRSTGAGSTSLARGSTGSLLYGTEIEIGRYLTSDVFVSATQPLGGLLPGATVEWTFLPDWRLEFATEDRARRYSAYGSSLNTFSDRTWRMMLFREWSF